MALRSITRSIPTTAQRLSRSYFSCHRTLPSHHLTYLQIVARPRPSKPTDHPFNTLPFTLLASSLALAAHSNTSHSDASSLQTDPFTPLSRVEHHTGVTFPVSLSPAEYLSGVGARFMRGLVKVYAVGVYLDPIAARTALADWRGFTADDIVTADPLWKTLCSAQAGFPRTVRMVVVRNVDGKHMQHGFERALLGRVAAVAKKGRCRPKESKAAVKQFCGLFTKVGTMKVGSDIRITLDRDIVTLIIDGRYIGKLQNEQLSWALLDMFVGDEAVVKGLREEVAKSLEQVLKE